MKRILLFSLVAFLIAFGTSDQASAMGKRGKGASQAKQSFSGSSSFSGVEDNDQSGGSVNENNALLVQTFSFDQIGDSITENTNNEGPTDNGIVNQEFYVETEDSNDRFPAEVPVPEPTTLALMGMGLGGLLLRRKKS